jgi:glycogenin glucosyltransferase
LNYYYPDWYERPSAARLPFRYNAQRTLHWLTHAKQPGYWRAVGSIAVLHFSSNPKPWDSPNKKGELELIWWKYFMQAQLSSATGQGLPKDVAALMMGKGF